MKLKKSIVAVIVGGTLCSCLGNSGIEDRRGTGEYTMELVEEKSFFLDSMTAQTTNYMQLLGDTSFVIFNFPTNEICLFDWKTGKKKFKISLHNEGPDAVRGIRGFYINSLDSIWLYNEWEKNLYLVNAGGVVKEKRSLQDFLFPVVQRTHSVAPFRKQMFRLKRSGINWFCKE